MSTTQYKTTQHNTTQHNTTQHNTKQHNTTQHNTKQHNTTQHNTIQNNTTQHNTTQYNTPAFSNLAAPKQGKKRMLLYFGVRVVCARVLNQGNISSCCCVVFRFTAWFQTDCFDSITAWSIRHIWINRLAWSENIALEANYNCSYYVYQTQLNH